MRTFGRQAAFVVTHPGAFTLRVLRAFRANQGLLLAGAVAYYTLLSIVPLLILILIALSQIIDQGELLATLGRYLEWLIPGQSTAVIGELARFVGPSRRDRLGAAGDHGVFQLARLHGAGKCDVRHLPAPRGDSPAPFSGLRGHSVLLYRLSGIGPAVDDARLRVAPGDGRGKHRLSRPQLVAPRDFGRAPLPLRSRGRDTRADVDLPRHAGGTAVVAARPDRRNHRDACSGRSRATSWSGISGRCPRSVWSMGR